MPDYEATPAEVKELVHAVLVKTFPDLAEAGLTVLVQMVRGKVNDEGEVAPALKLHGYPCAAIISLIKLKDRMAGLPDVRLEIDADIWERLSEKSRVALIDHELTHVVLKRDREGRLLFDDAGRPKVKLRSHDFQLGGFFEVCQRHGIEALEAQAYRDLHREFTQRDLFSWG